MDEFKLKKIFCFVVWIPWILITSPFLILFFIIDIQITVIGWISRYLFAFFTGIGYDKYRKPRIKK